MESFLEDLKNDVQCSLCNDRLTEPKILKCFHTFCKPCVKRDVELIEEVNVFKCPRCKSETPLLPELNTGVDDLKPSLLHSRMLKVLEFVESEKVCSVSGSHPPASWHCFDCNRSLCDECEKSHSMFTKDHKVVSVVDIKEEDIRMMMSRETNCEKHADKLVELFCKDCQQDICMECWKDGHVEHSIVTLSKYTSKNKAQLSERLEELKTLEQEMKNQVEIIEEETIESKANCEKAKLLVKERLRVMIDMLQKNAEELLKQIDENVNNIERRKVKSQSVLDQTRGVIEYMKKLIEKGVASEVIENKEMKKTCNTSIDCVGEQLDVLFLANKQLTKQVKSGLGVVRKVEKTDPNMSRVDFYLYAIRGIKQQLIVTTNTKSGNLNYNPSDVIDIKIHPSDAVKILKKNVTAKGKVVFEFIPEVACQLTAEVRVNGNHVSNSPLLFDVSEI